MFKMLILISTVGGNPVAAAVTQQPTSLAECNAAMVQMTTDFGTVMRTVVGKPVNVEAECLPAEKAEAEWNIMDAYVKAHHGSP